MEMQLLPLVVMVCTVSFGWTHGELSQIVTSEAQENGFSNFFNSIAQNGVYQNILKQEITREQQAFDAMKDELYVAQFKNAKKQRSFNQRGYIGKDVEPAKREATAAAKEIHIGRFDIRVGKIVSVQMHPDEKFFYVLKVDIGEKELRTMVLPIVKHVTAEQLLNRMALFLVNKKMYRITAQEGKGSIFHASKFGEIDILTPPKTAVPGDRVTVEGYERTPDEEINTKIDPTYEEIVKGLRTNDNKEATYRGEVLSVAGKGPAVASTMAKAGIYTA